MFDSQGILFGAEPSCNRIPGDLFSLVEQIIGSHFLSVPWRGRTSGSSAELAEVSEKGLEGRRGSCEMF